jgi:hypothetical protein
MTLRKITSLTMLLSFILLALTSIILYIVPHGRVAYWADWHLWGLTKNQWGDLHINLGFLFLLAGLLHLFYNWKPIVAYLKNRSRQLKIFTPSCIAALLITLVVGTGTLFHIPPMSTVVNFGETIKETASKKYGEPPYGHAELSSLKLFAKRTDLDLTKAITLLKQHGIRFANPQQTILEISRLNNVAPKEIGRIIAEAKKQGEQQVRFPDAPQPGFGNQSLNEICSNFHLSCNALLTKLKEQNITATPTQTIREIASANNIDTHAFFEILHNAATP